MFEVKQESAVNMGLVCDQSKDGLIAASKNGFMSELPGYGAPYIRPNFGKNAPTGIKNDTTVKCRIITLSKPCKRAGQHQDQWKPD